MERRTKRVIVGVFAAALGAVPAACLSTESDTPEGAAGDPAVVTFGAEVTVNVIGRGSVSMAPGPVPTSTWGPVGIACPPTCFARALVTDAGAEAGEGGVLVAAPGFTLEAHASERARFVAWRFEEHSLGARGRGPAECNPVKRDSVIPPVFPEYPFVTLPFGETNGAPPPGREAECAAYTTVPIAYSVTATFEEDESDVLFEPPVAGTVARDIGIAGNRLYWLFDEPGGKTGIATGIVGQSGPAQVLVPAKEEITLFDVGRFAVFTTKPPAGQPHVVKVIRENLGVVQLSLQGISNGAQPCTSIGSAGNRVYCRSPYAPPSQYTNFNSWDVVNGSPPSYDRKQEYYLPLGVDFVTTANALFYMSSGGAFGQLELFRMPLPGTGNTPSSPTKIAGPLASPRGLRVGPNFLFWLETSGGSSKVQSILLSGGAPIDSLSDQDVGFYAPDTDARTFWAALRRFRTAGREPTWDIVRAPALPGLDEPSVYRDRPTGVGGLVAGPNHVFWTQSDGRVYRARKR